MHHHQAPNGARDAACLHHRRLFPAARVRPGPRQRGDVPRTSAGLHPAPSPAGRHGLYPPQRHCEQWVSPSAAAQTHRRLLWLTRDVMEPSTRGGWKGGWWEFKKRGNPCHRAISARTCVFGEDKRVTEGLPADLQSLAKLNIYTRWFCVLCLS